MPLNMSAFDNVLQDLYLGTIRETINSEVPLFKYLDESDKEWAGRRAVWPVHTARNSGVGARAESAVLPTAGNQGHQLSVVSATYQYCRINLTGQTLASGKHAFAQALTMEMEGAIKDFKNDLGRQTWGTGDGRLAQVALDSNSNSTVTVFNKFFEPQQPGGRFVTVAQSLDFGTVALPRADASGIAVVSVSISTSPATTSDTITISATTSNFSQSDTFLFNANAGGSGIEMNGAQQLIDVYSNANMWGSSGFGSSVVQGIARATNTQWDSIILDNSGVTRILDGTLIQTAFDRINVESGEEPDMILGEHAVIRVFLDAVSADRRYQTASFDAGMSALSYNGVPLDRDRQAPYNNLLIFKRDTLAKFTLQDIEWADRDGSVLSRIGGASATDSWEAFLYCYLNIGINTSPKKACFIRDIRVDF